MVVQQQPRGSYTLEVFKGFLAVGGDLQPHYANYNDNNYDDDDDEDKASPQEGVLRGF